MEISFIDVVLIASVLGNFALLRKLSSGKVDKVDSIIFKQSIESTIKEIYEVKSYAENINLHHNTLSQSIIYHLHASGTVYQNRIWKTYEVEISNEWDFDQNKWPNYLPIINSSSFEISSDEYNEWLSVSKSGIYLKHPDQIVDYDYIYEMDRAP